MRQFPKTMARRRTTSGAARYRRLSKAFRDANERLEQCLLAKVQAEEALRLAEDDVRKADKAYYKHLLALGNSFHRPDDKE